MLSFLLFAISCQSDVSIIKRLDEDTSNKTEVVYVEVEGEPGQEVLETQEPTTEIDDTAPDTTQPDLSGVVGLARYHFRQIACPACVGEYNEIDITTYLKLHYPTTGDYLEHYQPVGTCTTNLYDSYVTSQPKQFNSTPTFRGNSQPLPLYSIGQSEWQGNVQYEYQYERLTDHSISIDSITILEAFKTVEGFDSIEPYTLLWIDPSYAFDAAILRTGMTFVWSPPTPDAQFEVIVAVYSWDGSQFLGAVSCLENDSGAIFIPSTYLQSYPAGSLAAVHLIRHRMSEVVSPELGGRIQTHMMWEVIGTGRIE